MWTCVTEKDFTLARNEITSSTSLSRGDIYKTISSYCTRKSSQDGMKTFFYCTSDEALIESKHLN